jgi:(S)-2-hydroxyglutarate dehydrogenase
MSSSFDFIVVGAGIVGSSIALNLIKKHKHSSCVLIDKESRVSNHQTGRNSGVIHSGIYYKPGSLKAVNCVNGYNKLIDYCKNYNINYKIKGKLVVARDKTEQTQLNFLKDRGISNGLDGVNMLSRSEVLNFEPNLNVQSALHVPQTGLIDYSELNKIFIKEFESLGGQVILNFDVFKKQKNSISDRNNTILKFKKKCIFAVGLQSDRFIKNNNKYKIIPFRGEYFKIIGESKKLVKNIVYPTPDLNFPFLGVHFTNNINDELEVGPNALLSFAREKYTSKYDININDIKDILTFKGTYPLIFKNLKFAKIEILRSLFKTYLMKEIHSFFPDINKKDVIYSRSGIRAQLCKNNGELIDDFKIIEDNHFVHLVNVPSPAATSSLSISEHIINNYL